MNLGNSTLKEHSIARPIRVDYVGVALLTLWSYLRKARRGGPEQVAAIFQGGVPDGFANGKIEDDLLRSLNITPGEAELFAQALELSLSAFGHDRVTLSRAIRTRLGDRVAGWRADEEWEMLRAAKIFHGQLEGLGLTSCEHRVRTINVCHYLITLARLCELSPAEARRNPLLRFMYSENELRWLGRHLDVAMKSDRYEILRQRYRGDTSFGRLAQGMMQWLRTMFAADLTLVLARFYRTSPAALAAQRQLRVRHVKDSLIVRPAGVETDTVVNRDDTAVDRTGDAPVELPQGHVRTRPVVRRVSSGTTDGSAHDAPALAGRLLSSVNPYDPWEEMDHDAPNAGMADTRVDDEAWRTEVAGAIRDGRRRRLVEFLRRCWPKRKQPRYR